MYKKLLEIFMPALPTLGIYGPGPDDRSGVSRYILDSLPYLNRIFDCRHVYGSNACNPKEFQYVLYHLGNNQFHHGAFRAMHQRPGAAILHEFNTLGYYLNAWSELDVSERSISLSLLSAALGQEIKSLIHARELVKKLPTGAEALDIGIEQLVIDVASPVFVHSPSVRSLLLSRYPSAQLRTLSFPVAPLPGRSRLQARERLGLPPTRFFFGVLGYIWHAKLVTSIVDTWCHWSERPKKWILVIAGERLMDIVVPPGESIMEFGYLADNDFQDLLDAVDCGIQLRNPSMGETSGVAASLLARGTAVIVGDPYGALAPGATSNVFRISTGQSHQQELRQAMQAAAAIIPTYQDFRPSSRGSFDKWLAQIVPGIIG